MVQAVRQRSAARSPNGLMCAEIIGLPGAGKSSLIGCLERRQEPIKFVDTYIRVDRIPVFLQSALRVAPLLVRSRAFSVKERIAMVRLQASPRLLAAEGRPGRYPILFDQGPLFDLSVVKRAAERRGLTAEFDAWWRSSLETWSRMLDLVVWLDASSDVLCERIAARDKSHKLQLLDEKSARSILERERADQHELIDQITRSGGPRVLRIDTSRSSLDQVATQVMVHLAGGAHESSRHSSGPLGHSERRDL